ncbi:PPOX class F420-dependent oxidoreductase [Nocardioides flavescens]|uniref:PPOX class F420-dependent oxidoreductase n=1 Tax=Nocardioides flavescens TaxID=2691959 RepID=A0A6L7F0I6_9ACTN|nr:PPOX class F420-dependent oxidoreductase [Nocardioides flavescens]MXG90349.1 PPOX class F420-dependent oxidoreductase [Nocardioides flavescens]
MTTLLDLGDESFVSLTTYRRTGKPVPTPVWVVRDGDDLVVWTSRDSGKVKRLRRDQRVALAPCSRRGRVAPDAPRISATARVQESEREVGDAERLLRRKYGVQFHLVTTIERVVTLVRRRSSPRVALRISAG